MQNFMSSLIPLVIGIVVLAFPQVFTKKDLKSKEGASAKKTIQIIGIVAIIISVVLFLKGSAFK
ncbi:MAG: hypothetical protein M0R20_01885 [Candidatus Omnitrophica bacterium]|jgi:cytochrome bd-type quinol oxidase subunit 2|nr:hypothetical protein [Candidatus Omnitrophota bacterium]